VFLLQHRVVQALLEISIMVVGCLQYVNWQLDSYWQYWQLCRTFECMVIYGWYTGGEGSLAAA
jgi:hypothetical protein